MKKYYKNILALVAILTMLVSCYKTKLNYPGGKVSPYIAIYDVRNLFKGKPVELNDGSLDGSSKIACVVVSDHRTKNLPEGLLIVQNNPRLNFLRGLAINIGAPAANYLPGDSLVIDIAGSKLEKIAGILQITNITDSKIQKIASDKPITVNRVNIDKILTRPDDYESTLIAVVKGGFTYQPQDGQVLSGEQSINDGFGIINVNTNSASPLAALPQYKMANYYGIVYMREAENLRIPYLKLRSETDLVELKSVYKTPRIIISGWNNDPQGSDSNNEYFQFLATEDIDFTVTPFSIVTTNNANAALPSGFPINGWATGQVRTYKMNIISGFVPKGTFFYFGGPNKLINSTGSLSMASSNWVGTYSYNSLPGQDFGNSTTNLLANSGNAYGVAIFEGTTVTESSIPEDVMFCATGGSLVGNGFGYRICNNDYYDIIDPMTLNQQPFYRSGNNTTAISYNTPSDAGLFNVLGGEFNMTLGRWTKARAKNAYQLSKTSVAAEIENPEIATKLVY